MIINAVLFNAQAVMGIALLKKIHSLYRQTDASFQKAQAEFATGVMSNQAVRQAAANAAASAASNAAQGAFTNPWRKNEVKFEVCPGCMALQVATAFCNYLL